MQQRNPHHDSKRLAIALSERDDSPCRSNAQWKLLVVDNDKESAELCASALREEGYAVQTAYSGADALRLMRAESVDLALTDMVMPEMDGMQFLANVKELYPETDVVVLTGFGTIEYAVEAMRRGAADFLPKPFRPRELKRLTASVLRAKHAEREESFTAQSAALLELAYVLARTADIHALPARAVALACESFDADAGIILVYDAGRKTLPVLAHAGPGVSSWGGTEDLQGQGMATIEQQKLLLSAEVESGNCYAYAPLVVAGHPKGVLCLRRDGGPWFHEKASQLLEIYASHLALALETTKLYDHASQQVAELEKLISVSQSLSFDNDIEQVCGKLLEGAGDIPGVEHCALLLCRNDCHFMRASPGLRENSALLAAIRGKMLAVLGMPESSDDASGIAAGAGRRLASFLSAPLKRREHAFGLLAIASSVPGCFDADAARRLTALSAHMASGMANLSDLERVSAMYSETIEMVSSLVDATNRYTLGHSRQVRRFSGELARALGLSREETYIIEDGALLHDAGKLCIPKTLLDKPGALTAEEFAIVASHPAHGANMFRDTPHMKSLVPILRHHHEHYDGSGYPDGLRGEAIPVGARIVALGDMFDALVSYRVYRPPMSVADARKMIAERGGAQFDPQFTKVFLDLPLEKLLDH